MLGLLGGTFDPVHRGHLDVARAARQALGLAHVWLVPARLPPHREPPEASPAHRFAMAAMAAGSEDGLLVSDLEMDAPGPSYTVATLDRLEARGIDPLQVCLVLGADAFRDIPSWKAYPDLLDRCHFAVVSRPGLPASELARLLPGLAPRMRPARTPIEGGPVIHLIDADTAAVSATDVRAAVTSQRPVDDLVPAPVAAHIARHGLYRQAAVPLH